MSPSPSIPSAPLLTWKDAKNDPSGPEIKLFLRSLWIFRKRFNPNKETIWSRRCDRWLLHATIFPYIKDPSLVDVGVAHWKNARMSFLNDHLDVLDSKINMLLTFNTLFLIAYNVLLNAIYSLLPKPSVLHFLNDSYHCHALWLTRLTVFFGGVWLLITVLCLFAARRIVWGDLGKSWEPKEGEAHADFLKRLGAAEKEHVMALIVAVVKRTNNFRIASYLTWVNVVTWLLAVILEIQILWPYYMTTKP